MSIGELKNKINKQLDEMDADQLKSAYVIMKELSGQAKIKPVDIDRGQFERQLKKGIEQLDNGEGTNFDLFLTEIEAKYGCKK